MSKEYYFGGQKRLPVGNGTDVGHDVEKQFQQVLCERDDESDERKLQHEILSRTLRAVDGVMRASRNPKLVWSVLVGTWIDQKTVPEICREECAVERTVRYILVEICAALKSVSV